MNTKTAKKKATTRSSGHDGFIDPSRLYTRRGFLNAAGLGDTTVRKARMRGVELPIICVGRQPYVRGTDGIAWIERLAELECETAANAESNCSFTS